MHHEATVVHPEHEHSYTVATESGNIRRNRAALVDILPQTLQKPQTPQKLQTLQRDLDQVIQPNQAPPRMALEDRVPALETRRASVDGQRHIGSGRVIIKPKWFEP